MLANSSFHGGPFTHSTTHNNNKPYITYLPIPKPHFVPYLSRRRITTSNRFKIRALNRDSESENDSRPFFPYRHTVKIPVGDRYVKPAVLILNLT